MEKGTSSSSLSNISGATSQQLVINKTGGGGETQTSTGTIFYNCAVSSTSATSPRSITWENRTSYAAKFSASAPPSKAACSGTSINIIRR